MSSLETLLAALASLATTVEDEPPYYVVTLDPEGPTAYVEAELPVIDRRLCMSTLGGVDDQPDAWATFVRRLEAWDVDGQPLALQKVARATWNVPAGVRAVRLAYEVDLSFCDRSWAVGNEQAGKRTADALYLVTRPLFVFSDWEGPARVRFSLPDGWRLSTPWAEDEPGVHVAESVGDLVDNTLVAGTHAEHRKKLGGFELILCLPGRLGAAAPLVGEVLERTCAHYLELFDRTPPTRYLMTFFHAEAEDGEAFRRSAAFTTAGEVTQETVVLWGNFLAHELFHFWNGQRIRGEPRSERQWFSEGVTEYYANRALLHTGAIDEAQYLEKAARHLGRYLRFRSSTLTADISLQAAGSAKGKYREGVYDAGWTVALCLDVLIRTSSSGERSLDDVLRRLDAEFGATGRAYRHVDLVRIASEVAATDLEGFFARHVAGTAVLPVADVLERAGFAAALKPYAGDVYLRPDEEAQGLRARLRDALLGRGEERAPLASTDPCHIEEWYLWTDDGVRHYVAELGRGPRVVVLHGGWGGEHSYLLEVVHPLAAAHRFVLYDQRGSLRSPAPDDSLSLDRLVADLEELRIQLGEDELTLLAHSMGAELAYAYLRDHPERVRGLVLMGPVLPRGAPHDAEAARRAQQRFVEFARANDERQVRAEGLDREGLDDRERTARWRISYASGNLFHVERWRRMKGGQAFYEPRVVQLLQANTPPEGWEGLYETLRAMPIPVRVLIGDHDLVDFGLATWPGLAEELAHVELFVLERAGHNAWIDRPRAFRAVLEQALCAIAGP